MTPVVVCSIFRNSASYVDRYFRQIADLRALRPVNVVVAEGDSTDSTSKDIQAYLVDGDIGLTVNHGGPVYGSIDRPQRWAQISQVYNEVFDAIEYGWFDQPVILVESDLVWKPETMVKLLADLEKVDAVAPLSMQRGRFYDIWGFRGIDGERFTDSRPYHRDLDGNDDLTPIMSAGSCIAMRPEVAAKARFDPTDGIVGFCRSIGEFTTLYCDPKLAVHHP